MSAIRTIITALAPALLLGFSVLPASAQDGSGVPSITFQPTELFTPLYTFSHPELGQRPTFASMHRGYLIVAGGSNGAKLTLWDINDPTSPTLHSSTPDVAIFKTHAMGFTGNLLTVRSIGGAIYDITDPANPFRRGIMGGTASSLWTFYAAPYIYKGGEGYNDASGWISILDASDPDVITVANELDMPSLVGFRTGSTHVLGNLLVVSASQTNGVVTFDLSDPVNPVLLDVLRIPGDNTYTSLLNGNRLYSGGQDGGLHVYDLTDPANIVHIGSVQPGGSPRYPLLQDEFIHLGNLGNDTYQKIDIDRMQVVASVPVPDQGSDPEVALPMGNLVFVGNSQNNISNPVGYLMAHDTDPDTRGMVVSAVRPNDRETGVATTSMIGIALTDQIDPRTVDASGFIVRPLGGAALAGTYTTQAGTINFVPDQPLLANTTYEVVVPQGAITDLSGNGISVPSITRFSTGASIVGVPPAVPTGLSANAPDNASIDLSWTDSSSTETSFLIERKTEMGPYLPLAEVAADATAYTDTSVASLTNYSYRIRAQGQGNSVFSSEALATTPGDLGNNPLVAHWRFDGDALDSSGNNVAATLNNGAGYVGSGAVGSDAVQLNGLNQWVSTDPINLGSQFSISMWARVDSGPSNIQTLVANTNGGAPADGFRFFVNEFLTADGSIIFETQDGGNGGIAKSLPGTFAFDQWNHLAVSVDTVAGAVRLYYNGVDVTDDTTGLTTIVSGFNTNGPLELGRMISAFHFNGGLDDVRLYGGLLTPTDVAQLSNPTLPSAPSGLNATAPSATAVDLIWSDNSSNELEFQIERRSGGGAYSLVASVAPDSTTFQDNSVAAGTSYTYRVIAVNINGVSGYSNEASVTTSAGTAPPGLTAHWEFDNDASDATGNGNTATLFENAGFSTDSAIGSHSLALDGNDDHATAGTFNMAENFTLSLWVKVNSGVTTMQALMTNSPGGFVSDGFRLVVNRFNTSDGSIGFETGNGLSGNHIFTAPGVFQFDQWNHVAVVVNRPAGIAALYYNGTEVPTDNGIENDFNLNAEIYLGVLAGPGALELDGNLDDVRIYSRELDPAEIAGLAAPGSGGPLQVQLPVATPALSGTPLSIDVSSISGGDGTLEYSWDFNDGSPQTPFLTSSAVGHVFTEPGHYTVNVTVRDQQGQQSSINYLQTIHLPLTSGEPVRSSPIIYDDAVDEVWTVNPDNDSVTRIDGVGLTKLGEYSVGDHPRTLAQSNDGSIWVVNQDDASISVLDSADGSVQQTIALDRGSAPYGIAMAPFADTAYVSLEGTGRVLEISTITNSVSRTLDIGPSPRGIAISEDGLRLFVTRFVSPAANGEVTEIDAASFSVTSVISLANDPGPDAPNSSRGIPNYISSITISPDGSRAWVPSKKDNTDRGMFRDGQPLTFESTVRAIASKIDMSIGLEQLSERIDIDNSALPFAVEFSPLGDWAFVALAGNNIIDVRDAYTGSSVAGLPTGLTPQGLILSDDGSRLFTHDFLQRTVSVFDVSALSEGTGVSASTLASIPTVASEALAPDVLTGKQIFYNAADLRMGMDGYISCATCHLDGGQDGRVWDFTDRGEGLRNTTDLRGRAGIGHGNVHWSANFDEIQDFENDIRMFFSGTGFMDALDFAATSDTLGNPKAGLSSELDDMAAYVTSLDSVPDSPYRNADGSLTASAMAGRGHFESLSCGTCHDGDRFIDELRHDVGTILPSSGNGNSLPLTGIGFDTPTLIGVWDTAPYLHDGRAATLEDALLGTAHGNADTLNPTQLGELVDYMQQIEDACDDAQPGDCDFDGVANSIDNCLDVANPGQEDADADGHGNHCDADFDQSCLVSGTDLGMFKAGFFGSDPVLDLDANGLVSGTDLGMFKAAFFKAPGPSAAGLCTP